MAISRQITIAHAFLKSEAAGGIVLMGVTVLALLIANSPAAGAYFGALHAYVFGLSVLHWINDGLMALFFLLVGLEIKREFLDGQLARWSQRALPGIAALGGMVVPALIYIGFTWADPVARQGWAIPAATDIAFALGVLALLRSRVPTSLKVFLTALAILDDLGAILIIAIFYSAELSFPMLAAAAACLVVLLLLNRVGITVLSPYLAIGALLWFFMLKSGIHATLAGVALALTIPLGPTGENASAAGSPLYRLEHALQPWIAFVVIPIFGFANAGLSFKSLSADAFSGPVPLGVAVGLFLGKQIGVFGFSMLAVRWKLAALPAGASRSQCYGVSLLCGIGFTMSLFIGALAFPDMPEMTSSTKVGVLAGSFLSALAGFAVLRFAAPKAQVRAASSM